MSPGTALAIGTVILAAVLAAISTAVGFVASRRIRQRDEGLRRLAVVEGKLELLDIGGSRGNRAQIEQLRKDLDGVEQLIRSQGADVDRRLGSLGLSMAQLAERLNGAIWGRDRTPLGRPRPGDRMGGPD